MQVGHNDNIQIEFMCAEVTSNMLRRTDLKRKETCGWEMIWFKNAGKRNGSK